MGRGLAQPRRQRFAKSDGWVLQVRAREGQKAGPGFMGLSEVVLPRGTQTRILRVDNETRTIEMEIV